MSFERRSRRRWIGAVLAAVSLGAAGTAESQTGPRFLNPPGLAKPQGYTQVVEVPAGHRLLFLSGQVPLDSAGTLRGGSDFRAQARQVFENLRAALAGAGADFDDVVKLNFYILDVRHLPVLREVRDQYVNVAAPPASTLVEVSRLFRDDVLLEVEAIAAVRP
jgi:enamine deaminase RidA (YjgF/YER057c/UK114 family)